MLVLVPVVPVAGMLVVMPVVIVLVVVMMVVVFVVVMVFVVVVLVMVVMMMVMPTSPARHQCDLVRAQFMDAGLSHGNFLRI
jgi:hypothetical protein